MSTRLAFIGADNQLHLAYPDRAGRRALTLSRTPGPLSGWGASRGRDGVSLPCWSPDNRWIGGFRWPEGEDGPAEVIAVQVDGIEERLLARMDDGYPVYCRWSPAGDHLAVLVQQEDRLRLEVCHLDRLGERRLIADGIPLFFDWSVDGVELLVHAGRNLGSQGHITWRRVVGDDEDRPLGVRPGSFCTPIVVPGGLVYGRHGEGGTTVCLAGADGSLCRPLHTLRGLTAFLVSHEADKVAMSSAPGGEGTPYEGLWTAPTAGGPAVRLTEDPLMAFFWLPGGRELVALSWDMPKAMARWVLYDAVGDSPPRVLAHLRPTRDQLFLLHFFEQFQGSHGPVSADGRWLCWATEPLDAGGGSQVQVLDLTQPGAAPTMVAEGSFAVFSR